MHAGYRVKADGSVEFIHRLEERNEFFGVKRDVPDDPRNHNAAKTELLDRAPRLFDRGGRILNRHESDATHSLASF